MKKFLGAAMIAGAAVSVAVPAHAQVSASATLTSDYVFRGLSLSGEDAAVQASFDYTGDLFYAGIWGSSLGSGGTSMELNLYGGFTPSFGDLSLDLGVVGYFYPGADDDFAEFDFFELGAGANYALTEQLSLGGGVYYTPENYGETGEATYLELNGAYGFSDAFEVSAAYGSYRIHDVNGPLAGAPSDTYNTWNLGASYAYHGFTLDLRYHDTDVKSGDAIVTNGFVNTAMTDGRVVFSISRAL